MNWVIELISKIRTVRAEMNIPAKSKTGLQVRDTDPVTKQRLKKHAGLIERMGRIDRIGTASEISQKGVVQIIVENVTYFLPVGDVIDHAQEMERLSKEIRKAEKEIGLLEKKLSNQKFISRAPTEVVQENQERLSSYKASRDKFSEAIQRLKSL